jgi:hypothetical protein
MMIGAKAGTRSAPNVPVGLLLHGMAQENIDNELEKPF